MTPRALVLLAVPVLAFPLTLADAAAAKPPPTQPAAWSSASAVSPIEQPDPTRGSQLNDVAVNASGQALAAWDQFSYAGSGGASIGVAIQTAGAWGAPFTLSATNGFSTSPRVAVGDDGTMAVGWVHQDPAMSQQSAMVAVKRPSGAWTTRVLASAPIGGVAITGFVPVVVDATGDVTAAWTLWDGARHLVQSAVLPTGGSWSATATVSATGADGLFVGLAGNSRGDAAIVYTLSPYTASAGTNAQYVYRAGPAGGWTTPVTVSETLPATTGYVTSPMVGLDASGRATVAYLGRGLEAVRQTSSGWTAPTVVVAPGPAGASYGTTDLATDAAGDALVVAGVFDPTIGVDRSSVWVSRGTPTGSWSPQQRLTDPSVPVDAYAVQAGMSPDGTLVLTTWVDHYRGTVEAARWVSGSWVRTATIGKGTAWSSFQEVSSLSVASATSARIVWKNAKTGTRTMVSAFRG